MRRVIQVGLGDLGRKTAADLAASGLGRVAAAVDADPSLVGRPLSELAPGSQSEARVAASLDELDDLGSFDAAIVMTRSRIAHCAPEFRALLAAGLPVVSTCEELTWPWLREPDLAARLDALARERGGRLLGTGVNPGFLMDLLPGVLAATCVELEAVRVERRIDASTRRRAFQRKIGAGSSLATHRERLEAGETGHVGLGESLHLLAALCGLELDSWSEEVEAVTAERALESAAGPVAAGEAAGVRQTARGLSEGRVVAELVFDARLDQPDPADEIRLQGSPGAEFRVSGGLHGDLATSALVVHSLAPLSQAPPGLWTVGDLPVSRRRPLRP